MEMSIERIIFGSMPLGIEETTAGIQPFTYTKGFWNAVKPYAGLAETLTASYRPPLNCAYGKWLESSGKTLREINHVSELARTEHPASLSFFRVDSNTFAFVYAKDMGMDWSGKSPLTPYHSAALCGAEDIRKHPVFYCDSPIVCCDVMREALFPSNGCQIKRPRELGRILDLSGENDIPVQHSAAFKAITGEDIIAFIKTGNHLQILKSMLTALFRLKEGEENCRIVIADEKDRILLWIAAISFLFPCEAALDLSFTSYCHSVGTYDINGVYVPELNGAVSDPEHPATDYRFAEADAAYAVYDFHAGSFAPRIDVPECALFSLLDRMVQENSVRLAEAYRIYIGKSTELRQISSACMDGAALFFMMQEEAELTAQSLCAALRFAETYAIPAEKKRIMARLTKRYISYWEDSTAVSGIRSFFVHCMDENLVTQDALETLLFQDAGKKFMEYQDTPMDDFFNQAKTAEVLLGLESGELERVFVNSIGVRNLLDILPELCAGGEIQRISYIHRAILWYVESGGGSFRFGTVEHRILMQILHYRISCEETEEETCLDTMLSEAGSILAGISARFLYYDTILQLMKRSGFRRFADRLLHEISGMYLSVTEEERRTMMALLLSCDRAGICIPAILEGIRQMENPEEQLCILNEAVTAHTQGFSPYITELRAIGMIACRNATGSRFYYELFRFLKRCEKYCHVPVVRDDSFQLLNHYLYALGKEHEDFRVDEAEIKCLKILYNEYKKFPEFVPSNTAGAFLLVSEMENAVKKQKPELIPSEKAPSLLPPHYEQMPPKQADCYFSTVSGLIADYMLYSGKEVNPGNIILIDSAAKPRILSYLFMEIMEHIEASKSKKRIEVLVKLIEYAMYLNLKPFMEKLPEFLTEHVNSFAILLPLEKDLRVKRHQKLDENTILGAVDTVAMGHYVAAIRNAYREKFRCTPVGKAGQKLNGFVRELQGSGKHNTAEARERKNGRNH